MYIHLNLLWKEMLHKFITACFPCNFKILYAVMFGVHLLNDYFIFFSRNFVKYAKRKQKMVHLYISLGDLRAIKFTHFKHSPFCAL